MFSKTQRTVIEMKSIGATSPSYKQSMSIVSLSSHVRHPKVLVGKYSIALLLIGWAKYDRTSVRSWNLCLQLFMATSPDIR